MLYFLHVGTQYLLHSKKTGNLQLIELFALIIPTLILPEIARTAISVFSLFLFIPKTLVLKDNVRLYPEEGQQ